MVKPIKIEIQLFASCCFSLFRKAGTILVHLEWCMIWSTMIFPQMIKHGRYTIVLLSFNEIQSNSICVCRTIILRKLSLIPGLETNFSAC